jgi:hypothetical protein
MMPEPITVASRNAVPSASATRRLAYAGCSGLVGILEMQLGAMNSRNSSSRNMKPRPRAWPLSRMRS